MFRINLFLKLNIFFQAIFLRKKKKIYLDTIAREISKQSGKKKVVFTNQCRVGLLYLLKYLKSKFHNKNQIIFASYNLAEMINVAKNLNFKVKFVDIDYKNGVIEINKLIQLVNKKTCAVVLTNMFNNYSNSLKIKNLCKKKKIKLIEDNAIYFDNYTKIKNKKIFSGYLGDYTLYSFNIMKHISAFFGGAVATNDKEFYKFFLKESKNMKDFFKIKLLKQIVIFFILKIMSIKYLYKILFIHIIKFSHLNNIKPILKIFYPSLKFKKYSFDRSYFTSISDLTVRLSYLQILDKKQRAINFFERRKKNIYYQKKLSLLKDKNVRLIKIHDFNYQNFIDYPILAKNKSKLNSYLLRRGFEIRYIYYKNCEPIFNKGKLNCKNSEIFEKEIICLPNHSKITYSYIDKIVKNIGLFYKAKSLRR